MSAVTILVVDDVEDTRDVWATTFRRAGFRVLAADSCAGALAALRQEERIDFVVTDYWLGDGLGEAMLRDAVTRGDLRPGSALICTALHSIERSSYAARVLHKPIGPDELIRGVRELLSADTSGDVMRVLLVCEDCNRFFHDGQRSLSPHSSGDWVRALGSPEELLPAARAAGWQNDGRMPARWSCPECLGRRSTP